ncbi:MAG: hypothetical protein ABIA04_07740 [Pseudomonadota bacterium]
MVILKKSKKQKNKLALDFDSQMFVLKDILSHIRQILGFLAFCLSFLGALSLIINDSLFVGLLLLILLVFTAVMSKVYLILNG